MKYKAHVLLICLTLVITGCFDFGEKDDSPVIAKVNDHELTLNAFKKQIPAQYLQSLGKMEKQEFIEQWVRQELMYQHARDQKLQKTPSIKFRLMQFERQLLADEVLQRHLADAKVTDAEALNYYQNNEEEFVREETEVKVSHIVVSDKNTAKDIRKKLVNGEDFATLAAEFSEDATGEMGGDLGFFSESDIADDLTTAAFELDIGGISRLIQTAFGFHLITVTEKFENGSLRDFEQVKADIINQVILQKQKELTESLLKKLEQNAVIETHPERLK